VNITAEGHGAKAEENSTGDETVDALLGVLRKMFPSNVIKAAVDMNILGVIVFAVGFGVCLSGTGAKGEPFMNGVEIFNEVIMQMVTAALWFAPIGVASLIAANLAGSCDPSGLMSALGLFIFNILLGLSLQSGVLLLLYWIMTKKNPVKFTKGFTEALVTAFGTELVNRFRWVHQVDLSASHFLRGLLRPSLPAAILESTRQLQNRRGS
jgi:Na+/H+-dicarboxylate symporter